MKQTSKTIVFFGTEDFSAIALNRLLENYKVDLIVTKPDSIRGRGRKMQSPIVKEIALEHNIPTLQPVNMNEVINDIKQLESPLGVLVSYGKIIPQNVLDLFPNGIINIHPSILPRYRGPSPIESAIYNGDKETGVTLMYLVSKMDAGPIISQTTFPTDGTETQETLYAELAEAGSDLMLDFLAKYTSEQTIQFSPQSDENATYTTLLSKDMRYIDTDKMTADEIERKIRAHHAFPRTSIMLLGEERIITKAHTVNNKTDTSITCRDKTYLEVDELIGKSGKNITLKDLLNSLNNK